MNPLKCFCLIAIILLLIAFPFFIYCYKNEPFQNNTNYTVNLPLTTTTTCNNFCGPFAKCAMTGQQCLSDLDCTGCTPKNLSMPIPASYKKNFENEVLPDNDAGKLTWGMTPQYSVLTSGFGTNEKIITSNIFSKPIIPNNRLNTWKSKYLQEKHLFDKVFKVPQLNYMPNYPKRYTLTGEFKDDNPLPSNAYLQ
jgi:hypothetical protein